MNLVMPGGEVAAYRVRTMYAQAYNIEDLFEKHLLVLLPFYIMRYEGRLPELAGDREQVEALLAECRAMRAQLEELVQRDANVCGRLVDLCVRVSDNMLRHHASLRKQVKGAMGGEILELAVDVAVDKARAEERAEAEAYAAAKIAAAEAKAAKAETKAAAAEGKWKALPKFLLELGVDEALVKQALADAESESRKSA